MPERLSQLRQPRYALAYARASALSLADSCWIGTGDRSEFFRARLRVFRRRLIRGNLFYFASATWQTSVRHGRTKAANNRRSQFVSRRSSAGCGRILLPIAMAGAIPVISRHRAYPSARGTDERMPKAIRRNAAGPRRRSCQRQARFAGTGNPGYHSNLLCGSETETFFRL